MSRVAAVFDDWARRGRGEGMEHGHLETARPALDLIHVAPGQRFLDLGCGNGWAARWAKGRGASPVAVDLSHEMVARTAATGIPALRCDMAHLPFPDAAFDHVWSMEAIYYAPDPDAVLREVTRILAPHGRVHLLLDHYQENAASHAWSEELGVPMALRSQAEWLHALQAAGLQDAHAQRLKATPGPGVADWKAQHGTLHLHATAPARNA